MKINTALILCAGYGKRLNPLTLSEPKPLLKINEITLLENCINLIDSLGIKKIIINTFYLKDKIEDFIRIKNFNLDIRIINDGTATLLNRLPTRIIICILSSIEFVIVFKRGEKTIPMNKDPPTHIAAATR